MLPMAEDKFGLEGVQSLRLKFNRGNGGEVLSVRGLYQDGRVEKFEKDKGL